LKTCADWAGAISTLNMEVELPTDAVAWITPPGYVRTPKHIQWHLTDYEPTQDLVILFEPEYNSALYSLEARLAKAKDPERQKLAESRRELARRIGQSGPEMLAVAKNLLPRFHIEPPTSSLAETLAESEKLVAGELP